MRAGRSRLHIQLGEKNSNISNHVFFHIFCIIREVYLQGDPLGTSVWCRVFSECVAKRYSKGQGYQSSLS